MRTHRWTLCQTEKQKTSVSTVMKEILSEFGLQGISHRSAAAVCVCTPALFNVCACVCVCHLSLLSCSVWVSYLGFNSLVSFWFWPLTASLPQKFPTSATSWARQLHLSSRRTRWWIHRCQHNTLAFIHSFQMVVKSHADSEGWKTRVKLWLLCNADKIAFPAAGVCPQRLQRSAWSGNDNDPNSIHTAGPGVPQTRSVHAHLHLHI